ncbi:MAG TPA: hypothetical protein VGB85_19185 [Nannocystis sp.]
MIGRRLLGVSMFMLAGCGEPSLAGFCANEEVASGLELRVVDAMSSGPAGQPRAGAYTFAVTTELGEFMWSCEISAADRIGLGCASDHQAAAADGMRHLLVSSVASEEKFWIDLKVIDSAEWRGPAEVHVEISRDGEVVADQQFTPTYTLSPASGAEGCPNYYAAEGEPPKIEL